MALREWKNLPDTSTPLNAQNLNYDFGELETTDYAKLTISAGSSGLSVTNANYVRFGTDTVTLNVKRGKMLLVFFRAGGLYNTSRSYSVRFDVKMDNTTTLTSGPINVSPAERGQNWSTDGTTKVVHNATGIFTNVTPGEHTFEIIWSSVNASVTAYAGPYSNAEIIIVEI